MSGLGLIEDVQVSEGTVRLRVVLILPALIGHPMTIRCIPEHGEPRTVRGWDQTPAPTTAVIVDHEAELGQDVTYQVLIDGTVYGETTVRLGSTIPLVTDPIRGIHVPVTIGSWPEHTTRRAGQALTVGSLPTPIIIEGIEQDPTSTITLLHTQTAGSADQLTRLLAGQSIIRVRPSCPQLPTVWASARGRSRRRFSGRPDAAVVDSIELRHIAQPWPDQPAIGGTLGQLDEYMTALAGAPTTLGRIATEWVTLADIAYEDLD